MEQRVSVITLGVADVGRSRRFYEGLGWTPGFAQDDVVFFQTGGLVFSLFARESLAKDANVSAEGSGFTGIALAHNVRSTADVDAVLAQAEAAGARILKPGQEAFWGGYTGYFADPDGHVWEVAWNPGWPIKPDGTIAMKASA